MSRGSSRLSASEPWPSLCSTQTDGEIFARLNFGQDPIQVLQWIASRGLGAKAFNGGLDTAFLGLVMHFVISLVFVTLFVMVYLRVPTFRANAIATGLAYGALVGSS